MQSAEALCDAQWESRAAPAPARVQLTLYRYPLPLRASFGTSHSQTTLRVNGLVCVRVLGSAGYAECGLPPKKPLCYESDLDDVRRFVEALASVARDASSSDTQQRDPFAMLQSHAVRLRHADDDVSRVCRALLNALDAFTEASAGEAAHSSAARAAVEAAVLDCWCRALHVPVYAALGQRAATRPSFITVSMQSSVDEMMREARFCLQHTRHLKIKVNADVAFVERVLAALEAECARVCGSAPPTEFDWSIDCNASWDAEVALRMLPILTPYAHRIVMVEQPFPLAFPWVFADADQQAWLRVRDAYDAAGLRLYADESVFDATQVDLVAPFVHGVNVKLEKAGGIRRALEALDRARARGLRTWLGIMVSSTLNVNIIAQLLGMCDHCDLDGSFLVAPDASWFAGGFVWSAPDGSVSLGDAPGFGVVLL